MAKTKIKIKTKGSLPRVFKRKDTDDGEFVEDDQELTSIYAFLVLVMPEE